MKLQELCTRHIRKLTRAIKRANVIYESEQSPTRLKREMVHVFRIASTAKTLLCAIMQNKSGADLRLGAHTRAAYFFPNHWRTFRAAGVRYSTTNDFLTVEHASLRSAAEAVMEVCTSYPRVAELMAPGEQTPK